MNDSTAAHGLSRRALLGRAAVAGAAAWSVPVISSLTDPVAAAVGSLSCPAVFCFDEGTTEGWTIDNSAGAGGTGHWNVNSSRSVSGSYSMHYGRGSTSDYSTGRNSGTVTSPTIALPAAGAMSLSFELWREIESYGSGFWDRFDVSVIPSGDVLYSRYRDGGNGPAWETVNLDLSAYAGTSIQVVFSFDTGDNLYNNFEGIYIDDVSIPCSTPPVVPGAAPAGASFEGVSTQGFFPAAPAEPSEAEKAERFLRAEADGATG